MIGVVVGTRAQLVKMAPVILEMSKKAVPHCIVWTGQHAETMNDLIDDFGINSDSISIYSGKEIKSVSSVPLWFYRCLVAFRRISVSRKWSCIVVHGDTFSTIIGALLGKFLAVPVGHVESGLRSFNLFKPFPEEIIRLCVFKLMTTAYCPTEKEILNLNGMKVRTVLTIHNTILDSLKMINIKKMKSNPSYAVVSIHRFENIFNVDNLKKVVESVEVTARKFHVYFVLHPATKERLEKTGLISILNSNNSIELLPRMPYTKFINLLSSASVVLTDGGSNQEELSYLGIPTLILRTETERSDGLGINVRLVGLVKENIELALADVESMEVELSLPTESASEIIVDDLIANY